MQLQIQHLDGDSESHRKVDVASLNMLAESVRNKYHSDEDQKVKIIGE
jgi:hypothetical protein